MSDIKVKGLSELNLKLKKLPIDIREKVLQSATTAAAKQFVEPARNAAPANRGDMAKSIKAGKRKTQSPWRKAAAVRPTKTGDESHYYWVFVEFGTVKQRPQPFLRPTFAGTTQQAAEKFREVLANGLKRYAG